MDEVKNLFTIGIRFLRYPTCDDFHAEYT